MRLSNRPTFAGARWQRYRGGVLPWNIPAGGAVFVQFRDRAGNLSRVYAASIGRQTGTVTGVVVNARTGRPVAGAVVRVPGTALSVRTPANGQFSLGSVPIGGQNLQVVARGYAVGVQTVVVAPGQNPRVRVALSPPQRR